MTSEELKLNRERMLLSQEKLAEIVGVSVHAVRKWEQGHRKIKGPALKLLREIFK